MQCKSNAKFWSLGTLTQDLYPASKELYLWFLDNFIQSSASKSCNPEKINLLDKNLYRP